MFHNFKYKIHLHLSRKFFKEEFTCWLKKVSLRALAQGGILLWEAPATPQLLQTAGTAGHTRAAAAQLAPAAVHGVVVAPHFAVPVLKFTAKMLAK